MGRLNLTPLRVRRLALGNAVVGRTKHQPAWVEAVANIPPAQILIRQQPTQHPFVKIRRKTLPHTNTSAPSNLPPPVSTEITPIQPRQRKKKASQIFQPVPIQYEEDTLRKQFYSDHPWELARPRVVLETRGDDSRYTDYSQNVRSAHAALSGESVVQRQLYLLHNVPDITDSEAYDIARKEFYDHRLQEDIERRVAVEEAQAVGADFGKSLNQRSIELEDRMYDDWEKWSRTLVVENSVKSAAFTGQTVPSVEDEVQEEKA